MGGNREDADLAGIQYGGLPGTTQPCIDAVFRHLQYDNDISEAVILSAEGAHCFLLTINQYNLVAIKSGFGSGYGGEGAHGFSLVLAALYAHSISVEEYEVEEELISRLDNSALRKSDLDRLRSASPIRPVRWHDFILESDWQALRSGELLTELPPVIPYALIDPRIMDLAISFWEAPDQNLMQGYRRLEDLVRKRIDSDSHGKSVFSDAFLGNDPVLAWDSQHESERRGRGILFTGTFMAYRNPRAHQETRASDRELLREFLLLNHLFILESRATPADTKSMDQ